MNIIQRFFSWLKSFKKSTYRPYKPKPSRPKYKGYCEHCGHKAESLDVFYCKYCKQYHCAKDRLPEDHDCYNPRLPDEMKKSGFISYKYKKK